ncbi:MAG: branched-chain amino acid ABC transporter permease [Acidimicrobiales bacterium]
MGLHRRGNAVALVVAGAILLPFGVGPYWRSTLVFILIAALGALGLDVLTGRTGQISLGHAFFLGAGAYAGGYLGGNLHLTAAIWIPAAGVVAAVLGAVVGPTALRLHGLYLAIVTIGLVFIGQHIFVNVTAISGGPGGRAIPAPTFGPLKFANGVSVGGFTINRDELYYFLALLLLALGMLYVRNLERTRLGRGMAAVRERELAAAVLGVNVARTKVNAFVISSLMAGIAGAMYASYLGFVVPTQWNLVVSIEYVVMIVVGGMANLWGPVLGAVFVIGLPALMQDISGSLPFISNGLGGGVISVSDTSAVIYGALLIVFLLVEPRGIAGLGQRLWLLAVRRKTRAPSSA